jgi:hypothetical protein
VVYAKYLKLIHSLGVVEGSQHTGKYVAPNMEPIEEISMQCWGCGQRRMLD